MVIRRSPGGQACRCSLYASPKFGLNLGAVTSAPHIHWGEMASMKKKPWVGVYFLTKLVDEASLVALSRMIWIYQQFSRLQNFDWSTWTVQAPFESAIHELLLRRRSWWIALSCLWCPFWTNLLEMEIPKVWRNILSTPERYGSGDRSFGSWPTQIVSVSKSYVVDRWNAVLCLQKSLCSRPDRCHCHRFCRRLGLLFILVHYRQLDLTPVDYCPQFSPAQAPCSWTFTSTKKMVDRTFLSVVNTLTIFTGNGGALSVGIYSVDPRKVWKWRSKFGDRRNVALFHAIEKCYFMRFVFTYIHHLCDWNTLRSKPVFYHLSPYIFFNSRCYFQKRDMRFKKFEQPARVMRVPLVYS